MSSTTDEEREEMKKIFYREAVGTLLWLSLGTKPDISFALSQITKFNDCYGKDHWQAVKKIFRYLKGTINLGLKYSSIDYSGEFREKFKSIRELRYFKRTIY